jgi:spore coat protein A
MSRNANLWRRLAVLSPVILLSIEAPADVVTLAASADNTIYSQSGTVSNGAGDHLFAGATRDGFLRRALIAFPTDAIPAGSTIHSVTLTLYMSRTRTQNQAVSVHRLLAEWGEGASHAGGEEGGGAPATTGDATWTHRLYPSTPWGAEGGDFVLAASGSAMVGNAIQSYSWSSAGLVADVQAWVAGTAPNHGWMLRSNESGTRVAKRFDSRSYPDPNRRPMLIVEFTAPGPTGACCATDGTCSVVAAPGTSCGGVYQGDGSLCTPDACPQPAGACCLPDAAASCVEVTEASCTAQGGSSQGASSVCAETDCPVVLTPFLDPLPLPAVAQPISGTPGGAASYRLAVREVQQQLHSQLPPTTVWGFGDGPSGAGYPGPTLEATVGQPIEVTWVNDLRDTSQPGAPLRTQHYFPVDPCPMGAAQNADARVVMHLHGGHVSEADDGYPEDTFPPGQQRTNHYPNSQLPATLWYHDHALGITRLNVQMGLAGFYLLRDATEQGLNLPTGPYEIPLAIQDRSFNPDGSLEYPETWMEHVFGDTLLVNGKVWPYLDVARGKYRFRMVNGSGSRTYRLALSSGASFSVIGMEGGLLPAPTLVDELTLGPGERADVVIDFAPYPAGTEILLLNSAPAPFPGEPGVGVIPNVMQFRVTALTGDTDPLPASLRPFTPLSEGSATVTREFHLEKGPADACSPFRWQIRSVVNGIAVGSSWEDVSEYPELGATEIWSFANKSGVTHPIHQHLVMFQVLDRQAFELVDGQIVPVGARVPPPPHEAGWKDTVQVGPGEIVRWITRFVNPVDPAGPTYTGLFPYHCHILEHEDHEMMRQYETTTTCGDGVPGLPAEECDDGNALAGDGCSPACAIEDECRNGIDDDGDGFADYPADPGCTSAADGLETEASLPCDDGTDNDGDGAIDFPDDVGCYDPRWIKENPQCDDGADNDGDGLRDWDGAGVGNPDPQCVDRPSRDREAASSCGLGAELALLLAVLRRARRSARGA